jgi:membrane-bound ClpP family serine protease
LAHISILILLLIIVFWATVLIEWNVGWWLIIVLVAGVAGFLAFAIRAVVLTQRMKQPTGVDGLIGATATVKTALRPKGTVATHGELWEAILDEGQADEGEEVIITEVKGLQLRVTKNK